MQKDYLQLRLDVLASQRPHRVPRLVYESHRAGGQLGAQQGELAQGGDNEGCNSDDGKGRSEDFCSTAYSGHTSPNDETDADDDRNTIIMQGMEDLKGRKLKAKEIVVGLNFLATNLTQHIL